MLTVIATLKKGIETTAITLNESNLYNDSKYVVFIKLKFTTTFPRFSKKGENTNCGRSKSSSTKV